MCVCVCVCACVCVVQGLLLVYDITDRNSYKTLHYWLESIRLVRRAIVVNYININYIVISFVRGSNDSHHTKPVLYWLVGG